MSASNGSKAPASAKSSTHDSIRLAVAERIEKAIREFNGGECPVALADLHDALVEPPNPDLGDLAFGCFPLAKALRSAPPQIATALKEKIAADDLIEKVEAAGPYLNFTLTLRALGEKALGPILSGEYFSRQLMESAPKTMIEYSQPNTHKELHVGHMRNLCLGDAIVRMMRYAGYDVVTSTFPGDVGTHVAKALWYMKFHNTELVPETGKGEWLGRMYSKGHLLLEDQAGTPAEAKNREQLTLILKQLEAKQGEYFDLWKETRQWSIDLMKRVYSWAGVEFDQWYWESDVDSDSVQLAREYFQQGKLVQSEGAIGMDLNEDGLGFMMLIKSDGTGLYATKDIELARRKFRDVHIQKSIYVVDMRQALHFKQVFKALEKLGFEEAKDCHHLQYNFVELPDGAMSSRKGNIVPLTELIHRMEETVKEQYLSRYRDQWAQDEIDEVAAMVAKGAIKYGMTRMDTNKKIVFDMTEWLKIEGESGPFVQYSHARIASLLRKLGYDPKNPVDWSLLTDPAEKRVVRALLNFNVNVAMAAAAYKPASICSYLYELAKRFNVFYHECPIGAAPSPELRSARLALSAAAGATLSKGLELLGVPAPQKM
jgi:arginyl-tRNA synthetase